MDLYQLIFHYLYQEYIIRESQINISIKAILFTLQLLLQLLF